MDFSFLLQMIQNLSEVKHWWKHLRIHPTLSLQTRCSFLSSPFTSTHPFSLFSQPLHQHTHTPHRYSEKNNNNNNNVSHRIALASSPLSIILFAIKEFLCLLCQYALFFVCLFHGRLYSSGLPRLCRSKQQTQEYGLSCQNVKEQWHIVQSLREHEQKGRWG